MQLLIGLITAFFASFIATYFAWHIKIRGTVMFFLWVFSIAIIAALFMASAAGPLKGQYVAGIAGSTAVIAALFAITAEK